jgi:hypothetical protein
VVFVKKTINHISAITLVIALPGMVRVPGQFEVFFLLPITFVNLKNFFLNIKLFLP